MSDEFFPLAGNTDKHGWEEVVGAQQGMTLLQGLHVLVSGDVEKPMGGESEDEGEKEDEDEAEEAVAEPGTEAELVFELWSELAFVDASPLEDEEDEDEDEEREE